MPPVMGTLVYTASRGQSAASRGKPLLLPIWMRQVLPLSVFSWPGGMVAPVRILWSGIPCWQCMEVGQVRLKKIMTRPAMGLGELLRLPCHI